MPTIEVRFEHLNVEAEAYVGNRALPTMFNFSVNIVEVLFVESETKLYFVLTLPSFC